MRFQNRVKRRESDNVDRRTNSQSGLHQIRRSYIRTSNEDAVQKKAKEIISHIPKDFTLAVEDESIFIHDTLIRRRKDLDT
jgi:hypothetical protein